MYRKFFKRILDILLSSIGLLVLSPLMLVVSLSIILEDRGPVIFRQRRVGKEGASFQVLKFRSMPINTRDIESAKANGLAVTKTGRIIRRTNIDEIPQLWNVLRGEMSLVGPRPIVESEIVRYGTRFSLYSKVLPGITGLWQVSGRNDRAFPLPWRLMDLARLSLRLESRRGF